MGELLLGTDSIQPVGRGGKEGEPQTTSLSLDPHHQTSHTVVIIIIIITMKNSHVVHSVGRSGNVCQVVAFFLSLSLLLVLLSSIPEIHEDSFS